MPPARLVYDDDCGFCTWSAIHVGEHAPDVELVAFSALSDADKQRLPPDWERCAHLFVGAERYSCGEAMTRAYELTDLPLAWLPRYLRRIPGFAIVREAGYRVVAANRDWFGRHVGSREPPMKE